MIKTIVLGGNGQLGKCLAFVERYNALQNTSFHFLSSAKADITNYPQMEDLLNIHRPHFIVNAAAYTKVDLAEKEKDKAFLVNAFAVENLAKLANKFQCKLIHISTDYVFDGTKKEAYTEEDRVNPINIYGASKQEGEQQIRMHLEEHFIIRTSWLYSDIGHNFYNIMLSLFAKKDILNVTTDQVGCPTNAYHLASLVHHIVATHSILYGTYHYCNTEATTWFEFATQILSGSKQDFTCKINPVDTYPTPARRPAKSVLDTSKIKQSFGIKIATWKEALEDLQSN